MAQIGVYCAAVIREEQVSVFRRGFPLVSISVVHDERIGIVGAGIQRGRRPPRVNGIARAQLLQRNAVHQELGFVSRVVARYELHRRDVGFRGKGVALRKLFHAARIDDDRAAGIVLDLYFCERKAARLHAVRVIAQFFAVIRRKPADVPAVVAERQADGAEVGKRLHLHFADFDRLFARVFLLVVIGVNGPQIILLSRLQRRKGNLS